MRKNKPCIERITIGKDAMPMKDPCHPGEIVREGLDRLKLNVTDGAAALGVTRTTLSRVLNGKTAVSPEMAVRRAMTDELRP